jgi:hypothetical protein
MPNTTSASRFAAKSPVSDFLVGPHSRASRNGILFNDRSSIECYWVEDFIGFDSADLLLGATPNTEEDGELPDPGFHGGRTMTMTGWIQAGSYPQVIRMGRDLLDSLIDLVELPMTISHAPTSSYFTHPDMNIMCRPGDKPLLDMKLQPADRNGIFKRNFTIALRASDPKFLSNVLQTAHLIPLAPAIFGRTYPRSYNIAYTTPLDPSYNPAYHPDIVTIHTDGNYESAPIIRFNGGMSGVVFTNQTNGHVIRLNGIISAGDYIEIDVKKGTVVDKQGNDKTSMFDTTSDWLLLQGKRNNYSGDNVLTIQAQWFDSTGTVDVWWRDTSI